MEAGTVESVEAAAEEGSLEEAAWEMRRSCTSPRARSQSAEFSPIHKHRRHVETNRSKPNLTSRGHDFSAFGTFRQNYSSKESKWSPRGQRTTTWGHEYFGSC